MEHTIMINCVNLCEFVIISVHIDLHILHIMIVVYASFIVPGV